MRTTVSKVAILGCVYLLYATLSAALDTEGILQRNQLCSVVVIGENARGGRVVQASGCVVDKRGWILATAHQVKVAGITRLKGRLSDGSVHDLQVVEVADDLDLALLKSNDPLPAASVVGDASHLKSGAPLVAITTPENLEFTAAKGIVTNALRIYKNRPFVQTDLPFTAGSSGGPVFDETGALVGIVFGRINVEGLAATLICPINRAYPLLAKHGISFSVPHAVSASEAELHAIPTAAAAGQRLAAVLLFNRGVAANQSKDKIRLYQAAVEKDPQLFEAWFNLGVAYTGARQPNKAIQAYRKAETIRPDAVPVQHNLGRVFLKIHRMEEALACFQRAVQLAPDNPGALNDLGEAYRQTGKYQLAESSFRKAIAASDTYAPARYNLGLTYVALGQPAKAVENLEGYLKLKPNAPDAERIRAWIKKLKSDGKPDTP